MKNLSYISKFSYEVVRQQVGEYNAKLEKIRSVLAEKGEGMTEAIEYQKKGSAWKRKQVLAECEDWMNATNCPSYLREENRKKAYDSCDNDYIAKVATAFSGLKLNLETEVEVNSEGEWQVAEKLADEMLESRRYTLTPEEVEAYGLYQELLAIAKKLHERNYFITANFIGEDCLYPCDTEEEDMQQFLLYYREPK